MMQTKNCTQRNSSFKTHFLNFNVNRVPHTLWAGPYKNLSKRKDNYVWSLTNHLFTSKASKGSFDKVRDCRILASLSSRPFTFISNPLKFSKQLTEIHIICSQINSVIRYIDQSQRLKVSVNDSCLFSTGRHRYLKINLKKKNDHPLSIIDNRAPH